MFSIDKSSIKIDMHHFVSNYHDLEQIEGYCKVCPKYKKCWTCPPFDFCINDLMSKYKYIEIFAFKAIINTDLQYSKSEKSELLTSIFKQARIISDEEVIDAEQKTSDSLAFYAGSCIICPSCLKNIGEPCAYPNKSRLSLESIGFDVSLITSKLFDTELKWGNDEKLPEYLVLISAIMHN